jgi:hypothetical protein
MIKKTYDAINVSPSKQYNISANSIHSCSIPKASKALDNVDSESSD